MCTTNPTFGRGLSLAASTAADLVDTLDKHGDNSTEQAIALDGLIGDHVRPYYEDQAATDAARLAMLRHTVFGEPLPRPPTPGVGRINFAQLRAAAPFDPNLFRAFWRLMGTLCLPADIYADPAIVATTAEVLRCDGSQSLTVQPTREQLATALGVTT